MKVIFRHRKKAILVTICVLQFIVLTFFANKKEYLFIDELFSCASSNHVQGPFVELPENKWLDKEWYIDYAGASKENRFDFSIPYHNQESDVHPPLFYMLLHGVSSVIPDDFSFWPGLGLNILLMLICTVSIYYLTRELFTDEICSLLTAALFGITYGAINMVVFIRMYMLLALIIVLHTLVYVKYLENEEPPKKAYVYLAITLILGTITQYYFLFPAFFLGVWYTVKFIKNRQYRKLCRYLGSVAMSGLACLAIYPTMWKHIFQSGRGVEAQGNFIQWDGYLQKLVAMWKILDKQLFSGTCLILVAGMLLLAIISIVRKKEINIRTSPKLCAVIFVCIGYIFVVAKISPYQVDRYLMPIYPLIYVIVAGTMYILLRKLFSKRLSVVLCLLGFLGLSTLHIAFSGIPYTYSRDENVKRRLEVTQNYSEYYAVYVDQIDDDIAHYYDVLQVLIRHKGFYFIKNLDNLDRIKNDMQKLSGEKQFLVYINKEQGETQNIYDLIEKAIPNVTIDSKNIINTDERWDVYLLDIQE